MIYQTNFQRLRDIIPDLDTLRVGEGRKSKSSGFMDLNLDVLDRDETGRLTIALSHYYELNGDLVPDPDMTMRIDFEQATVEALTYQDIYSYQEVYPDQGRLVNLRLKGELNRFLRTWLTNLKAQRHRLEATASENGNNRQPQL